VALIHPKWCFIGTGGIFAIRQILFRAAVERGSSPDILRVCRSLPMTAFGAEQKLMFKDDCFRFCPLDGLSRRLRLTLG
jgi:hypothetical protein